MRWACLAVLWAALVPAPALAAPVELIFAGDLFGDFTPAGCTPGARKPDSYDLSTLATAITQARQAAPGALVLGGPGFLGAANSAAFLLSSPSGSQKAAQLMRQSGVDVFIPGVTDFATSASGIAAFLAEVQRTGRPGLLSNVKCVPKDAPLCQRTTRQIELDVGGARVGLLAVVSTDLPKRVAAANIAGLAVQPLASIVPLAQALRRRVDVLVVLADLDTDTGLRDGIGLAQALDEAGARADVIYISRLYGPHLGVDSVALSNGTALVGAPRDGAGVMRVSVTQRGGPRGQALATARRYLAQGTAPAELLAELEKVRVQMCGDWGQPVAELPAAGLDRAALLRVVLDAMRAGAHADIAMINAGAVVPGGLPVRSATLAELTNAMPFAGAVVQGRVPGKVLTAALGKYLADENPRLVLRGLEKQDGGLKVNGRPLDPVATYRVVTLDFVAQGGNDLVSRDLLTHKHTLAPDVRRLLLDAMQARHSAERVVAPLELNRRPLWSTSLDLGLDLQSVTISNPGSDHSPNGYDRAQLSRAQTLAFKTDDIARLEMDQRDHLLQLSARVQYGLSQICTPDMTHPNQRTCPPFQETVDLVNLLALYTYRGFSARGPHIPTPYSSLGLESEFIQPATRTYHHLELSFAAGARAALIHKMSANLGVGLRQELLADANSLDLTQKSLAHTRLLLTATLELQKRALVPRLGDALLGEFALTYSFTDPTALQSHELRATGKLYIELSRPLYLTAGADLYVYQARDGMLAGDQINYSSHAAGVALDVTAGLKVLLSGRRQTF